MPSQRRIPSEMLLVVEKDETINNLDVEDPWSMRFLGVSLVPEKLGFSFGYRGLWSGVSTSRTCAPRSALWIVKAESLKAQSINKTSHTVSYIVF